MIPVRSLRPFLQAARAFSDRPKARANRRVKGKQRASPRGAYSWGQDESQNFWGLRPGVVDRKFQEDALVTKDALKWHRKETQFSGEIEDSSWAQRSNEGSKHRWWDSWEAEWDDGWDWEEKWQSRRLDGTPAGSEVIVGKEEPRRPKGPMWLQEGVYQPVPTLNHSQLAEAIVDARNKRVDELHWQALCRRAELVAMSMTPAELLAVSRCVAERQSGQLRLLWKIATFMVERIGSYTTTDLVCLAHVYSSLDAVHHGMLNVVALILASPEDERMMDATLAVDALKSFARAQYPLPLLIGEVRRILLCENSSELKPSMALSALDSFSRLKGLDGELLSTLLPTVLGPVSSAEGLAQICAAASWAYKEPRKAAEASQTVNLTKELEKTAWMSLSQAHREILNTLVKRLEYSKLQQLQVLRQKGQTSFQAWKMRGSAALTASLPLCVVPTLDHEMASVKGDLLLAAAHLLVDAGTSEQDTDTRAKYSKLAGEILIAAAGTSTKLALWPSAEQVQWLTIAVQIAEVSPPPQETLTTLTPLIPLMLRSISALEASKLTMISAEVADVLPRILKSYGKVTISDVSVTVNLLCNAVRPELYRLRLQETYRVLHGSLTIQASVAESIESTAVADLLKTVLQSLPTKLKSESVFHQNSRPSGADLAAWCSLLANFELISPANVPEEVWKLLSLESQNALVASGLGEISGEVSGAAVAKQMLDAFLQVKDHYHWKITDDTTPLGIIALAVQTQWKRAIARDGELEDPMHEPAPIPTEDATSLKHLFENSGIELPTEVRI